MNLILLGPPGAGKGTQAAKIIEKYGIPHISTGDIFRKNISEGTRLGKKAKEYMDKGELVPDSLVIEIATDRLLQDDCQKGFLLDGFPRTVAQAEELDKIMKKIGKEIDKVIALEVSDDEIIERITGRRVSKVTGKIYHIKYNPPVDEKLEDLEQRADDNEETVKKRLAVYNEQTAPVLDFYKKQNKVYEVDGAQGLENITKDIIEILEK